MAIKEFKVVARQTSNVIKGSCWSKELNTVVTFFKSGGGADGNNPRIINRPATKEEASLVHDVTLPSKEPMPGRANETRFFGSFKFFDEETEKSLKPADKHANALVREWYRYISQHDHVIIKGADGNNTNNNDIHSAFELIDITGNTQKTVELNKKRTEAGRVLLDLFESSKDAFKDFCYAYGVPDVVNLDPDTLYNICVMKMAGNPGHFMTIYNNKNRDILTLIEKAFVVNIGTSDEVRHPLDCRATGTIYLDGEPIAQKKEGDKPWAELEEVLLVDVAKRRVLEGLVGYKITAGKAKTETIVAGDLPDSISKESFITEFEKNGTTITVGQTEPTDVSKEAKDTGKKEAQLRRNFINNLRPILNFTKDLTEREKKIKLLLDAGNNAPIKDWAKEYAADAIKKKEEKAASKVHPGKGVDV